MSYLTEDEEDGGGAQRERRVLRGIPQLREELGDGPVGAEVHPEAGPGIDFEDSAAGLSERLADVVGHDVDGTQAGLRTFGRSQEC